MDQWIREMGQMRHLNKQAGSARLLRRLRILRVRTPLVWGKVI